MRRNGRRRPSTIRRIVSVMNRRGYARTPRANIFAWWTEVPYGKRLWKILVDRFLESSQSSDRAVVVKRQQLHHVDAADVLYGIDPEFRVEDTGPTQTARTPERLHRRVVRRDLKTQAEFV